MMLLASVILAFFLHVHLHLRNLHSFPTRRSSDLNRTHRPRVRRGMVPEHRAADGRGELPRSEEHTSELESRLHLVCRLLLEKKKKAQTVAYQPSGPRRRDPIDRERARTAHGSRIG